ncbi:hypothetical protein [Pseudomonas sp. S2_F03]
MRMVAQLIDTGSGAEIDTLRRNSAFRVQQQGHRLQVTVVRSAKGEADSATPELAGTLGLFIFRSDTSVSYWMRSLHRRVTCSMMATTCSFCAANDDSDKRPIPAKPI